MDNFFDFWNEHYNMISLRTFSVFFAVISVFMLIDMITGIVASKCHGSDVQSSKWGLTVNKFISLILYFGLVVLVSPLAAEFGWLRIMLYVPIILWILREYMSIGENMAILGRGKKPYIFRLIDTIFNLVEKGFLRMLRKRFHVEDDEEEASLEGPYKNAPEVSDEP